MKKRRLAIVAFLLCACMVIGIGYAAVSRELYVVGTVNVANSSLNVVFSGATNDTSTLCTEARVVDDTHVRMTTGVMNEIGQKATATFIITNNMTDTAVKIEHINHTISGGSTIGLDSSYFNITREFSLVDAEADTDVIIGVDAGDKPIVTDLPAGKSVKLTITIEVAKSITVDLSGTSQLELTGEFLATSIN